MLKGIPLPAVLIDVETTGGSAIYGRITEIGIIEIDEHEVRQWSTLINPNADIPLDIQKITGITNDMVANAPRFEDVAEIVLEKIKGKLFIAHNVRFDYGFICRELARAGIAYRAPLMCSVLLSRELYADRKGHSLEAIIKRHQIFVNFRHRALDDAIATYKFLEIAQSEHGVDAFRAAVLSQFNKRGLPSQLNQELLESLPMRPGIFYCWNESNELIYIGKSRDIRNRVLSLFADQHPSSYQSKICSQTRDITWDVTTGELSALILHAQKITALNPVLNKKPQVVPTLFSIELKENAAGWLMPNVVSADDILTSENRLYGLFTSVKKSKNAIKLISDEYRLCYYATGVEKISVKPCVAFQLRRCKGLCIGLQPIVIHNMQMLQAFGSLALKTWPYKGAISIIENRSSQQAQHIIIKNWCLMGVAKDAAEYQDILSGDAQPRLDRNIYRYLLKIFSRKFSSVKIISLE